MGSGHLSTFLLKALGWQNYRQEPHDVMLFQEMSKPGVGDLPLPSHIWRCVPVLGPDPQPIHGPHDRPLRLWPLQRLLGVRHHPPDGLSGVFSDITAAGGVAHMAPVATTAVAQYYGGLNSRIAISET